MATAPAHNRIAPPPRANTPASLDRLTDKEALEGASGNLNWAADRPISDWDGIAIANNRVSRFEQYAIRMNGAMPAKLGNLASLDILNLNGHHLTGEIPAELATSPSSSVCDSTPIN